MTQRDRDRLVALKKAKKGVITQRQAAEEIGQTERNVRRLLTRLKGKGDKAIVHALRGRRSNRKLDEEIKRSALEILSREVYAGFGPTLAAEYLAEKHGVHAGRETVRSWMIEGKLWRAQRQRVEKIHPWRQRRTRVGELVQWDTSEHAWLEDRGPKLYLISMIDDATSRIHARFVLHDSTEENMRLLWSYVERYAYTRLDTRIGWRLGEFAELSIVGQNLLRPGHVEFYDPKLHQTDVERSFFGKITWRF